MSYRFLVCRNFLRIGGDRVSVLGFRAVEVSPCRRCNLDIQCFCYRISELLDIWDPVADSLDIKGLSGHHLRLEAILLRFLQRPCKLENLAEGEIGLDRAHDFLDDGRKMRDNGRRYELIHTRLHELLLALDAADVALLITVADIGDGRLAVHMLHTGLKVNDKTAVIVPWIFVFHSLFDVDINAADGIDNLLERLCIDNDIVIDIQSKEIFNSALRQFLAAISICRIDLIPAVSLDLHASIAWDRKKRCLVLLRINRCYHERITSPDIVVAFVNAHDHNG